MPRLRTTDQPLPPDDPRAGSPKPAATRCRPCPRCYVPLVLERQYRTRGLSGVESRHETYICPACDARFQHGPVEGHWKTLGEAVG